MSSRPERVVRLMVEADELDGGYIAYSDDVPGAYGQGETRDEAIDSLVEAIIDIVDLRLSDQVAAQRADTAYSSGRQPSELCVAL